MPSVCGDYLTGTVTVLLNGQIHGQDCKIGGGSTSVATLPLQHKVVLRIHRTVGFAVEQFNQRLFDCKNSLVLLANVGFQFPSAKPVDAAGKMFEPSNAPTPAAITLHSSKAINIDNDSLQVTVGAGHVTMHVDTDLPVQGLHSFDVVAIDTLTAVQATLYLNKAMLKGRFLEPIKEGMPHRIFIPGELNTVDVRSDSALTAQGTLCAAVPGSYFRSTSLTPEYCASVVSSGVQPASSFPLATIKAIGDCELTVSLPGTNFQRTVKFRTTL